MRPAAAQSAVAFGGDGGLGRDVHHSNGCGMLHGAGAADGHRRAAISQAKRGASPVAQRLK